MSATSTTTHLAHPQSVPPSRAEAVGGELQPPEGGGAGGGWEGMSSSLSPSARRGAAGCELSLPGGRDVDGASLLSARGGGGAAGGDRIHPVPIFRDSVTFDTRQAMCIKELERRMHEQMRRKEKDWQRTVERMREEFLSLHPYSDSPSHISNNSNNNGGLLENKGIHSNGTGRSRAGFTRGAEGAGAGGGGHGAVGDELVTKRRGSTDLLDLKKMRTIFVDREDTLFDIEILSSKPPVDNLDLEPRAGGGVKLAVNKPVKSSSASAALGGDGAGRKNGVTDKSTTIGGGGEGGGGEERGRRFQLRFNLSGFDPGSIVVSTDGLRIVVRARRAGEEEGNGHERDEGGMELSGGHKGSTDVTGRDYCRKIFKPKEVDHSQLRAYLSADGVLVIEAPVKSSDPTIPRSKSSTSRVASKQQQQQQLSHSKSHQNTSTSHASSHASSNHDSAVTTPKSPAGPTGSSLSPTSTPGGGGTKEKIGVPIFRDENGTRKMNLIVDLGAVFNSDDVTVQVIKENKIQIRAKHRVKTVERLSKHKFNKEYELGEKIETYSLRGGLNQEGRLVVTAYAKGHGPDDIPQTSNTKDINPNNTGVKSTTPRPTVTGGTRDKDCTPAPSNTEAKSGSSTCNITGVKDSTVTQGMTEVRDKITTSGVVHNDGGSENTPVPPVSHREAVVVTNG